MKQICSWKPIVIWGSEMEMTFRGRESRELKKKNTAEILKDTGKDLAKIGEQTETIQSKKDQTILKKSGLEYK